MSPSYDRVRQGPNEMSEIDFKINVTFEHRVRFTRDAFSLRNDTLRDLLGSGKVLVFIEDTLRDYFPRLEEEVLSYLGDLEGISFADVAVLKGGEESKQNRDVYDEAVREIEAKGIDRHSYVFAIGGGAFLDVIGFAAATAHRGIRLIRFPTTTLSQDDSGVGVKNGINAFGKKNFVGTFAVPYAVVNDFSFLATQPPGIRREGLIEAVKVALVRDASFFEWIEANVSELNALEERFLEEAVERSAILHAQHIAEGGDPFETGSSRPLDYGHWSAHKMEQLSRFRLSHGEAVSIGVALDTLYASEVGLLSKPVAERVLRVIEDLSLPIWDPVCALTVQGKPAIFRGLEEFREHLGGELTVLLLAELGQGVDVHHMDQGVLARCLEKLAERSNKNLLISV